jgi:two-component system, NarL family, response regulator DevR
MTRPRLLQACWHHRQPVVTPGVARWAPARTTSPGGGQTYSVPGSRGPAAKFHDPCSADHTVGGNVVPMAVRIFLLDDHEIVRRGLREVFEAEEDMEVVGEAGNAEEAMARVPATRPDVAVLDVRLPGTSGIEVCRDLRALLPDLRCLMLPSFADDDALFSAILAGASGYLLKQIRGSDLVSAVRRVAEGQSLIDPALTAGVLERLKGKPEDERIAKLSTQERRILDLIAEGKTNRQIGADMYLAEKTVKNYVSNMLAKMGFSRRTEAAVYATRTKAASRPDN